MTHKNNFITKNKQRKALFISLCVIVPIIMALFVFYVTVHSTHSLNRELLGEETYTQRMNDSYRYALYVYVIIQIPLLYAMYLIKKVFTAYENSITSLSKDDFEQVVDLNNKEVYLRKYLPPYIIKEQSVTFFTLFSQQTIPFKDIRTIYYHHVFIRGYKGYIEIHAKHKKYIYIMRGNYYKLNHLLVQALLANPAIVTKQLLKGLKKPE